MRESIVPTCDLLPRAAINHDNHLRQVSLCQVKIV